MRLARIAAVTATGMAMVVMSACGSEKADETNNATVDAKTLAQQAQKEVDGTKTVRISGGGTVDLGDGETFELKADMCVSSDNRIEASTSFAGAEIDVLAIGDKTYTKGSRAAWDKMFTFMFDLDSEDGAKVDRAAYEQMLGLLDNRWLEDKDGPEDEETASASPSETPSNDPFSPDSEEEGGGITDAFLGLTDVKELFGDDYDKVVKGDPVEYEGKRVIPLSVTDKDTDEVTTVYVPEKGKQIPVRITYETPGTSDKAEFKVMTGGKPCDVKAPPVDQLVDKAEFEKVEGKVFDFGDFDLDDEGTTKDDAPAVGRSPGTGA